MIEIPVYDILIKRKKGERLLNLAEINRRIDRGIRKYFVGHEVCIRCVSSAAHKDKTVDDLIEAIKKCGSDRYNSSIRSDRYDNDEGKHIDFFALDFSVRSRTRIMDDFTWRKRLRPPVRIDILIVYDARCLKNVLYTRTRPDRIEYKRDGFVFKDPLKKPKAIKAIFKIRR